MPWKIKQEDGKHCVVKKTDGTMVKCHDSNADAVAHMRALYANEDKENPEATVEKEYTEKGYYGYYDTYVPWNVTSFAQFDSAKEQADKVRALHCLGDQFQQIASNILYDSDVADKGVALQNLVNEYSQRIDSESTVQKSISERFFSLFRKPDPPKPSQPENTSFLVWKEDDGTMRWFGLYSNNCEDNQGDVITKEAHETFVDLVDEGVVPYPALWYWHIPGLEMGTTEWMAESDGFVLSAGTIHKEMEEFAESVAQCGVPHRMSHGMVKRLLVRDADTPSHINFYVSKELTALPSWAAANSRTDFALLTKEEMMLNDTKKAFLRERLGLDDTRIKELEEYTANQSKEADSAGVQRKEDVAATEAAAPTDAAPQYATVAEVADALAKALNPIIVAITELGASVGDISSTVKELSTADEQRIVKQAEKIPAASLEALLSEKLFGATFEKGNEQSGRTFAKPREADPAVFKEGRTGIGFIDDLIEKSQNYQVDGY